MLKYLIVLVYIINAVYGQTYASIEYNVGNDCSGNWGTSSYYLDSACYQSTIFTCDFTNQQVILSSYRDINCQVFSANYTYPFNECYVEENVVVSCITGYPDAPINSYSYFIYPGCGGSGTNGIPLFIDISPINECQQNDFNTFEYTCNSTDLIYNSFSEKGVCNPDQVIINDSWPLKTPICHEWSNFETVYTLFMHILSEIYDGNRDQVIRNLISTIKLLDDDYYSENEKFNNIINSVKSHESFQLLLEALYAISKRKLGGRSCLLVSFNDSIIKLLKYKPLKDYLLIDYIINDVFKCDQPDSFKKTFFYMSLIAPNDKEYIIQELKKFNNHISVQISFLYYLDNSKAVTDDSTDLKLLYNYIDNVLFKLKETGYSDLSHIIETIKNNLEHNFRFHIDIVDIYLRILSKLSKFIDIGFGLKIKELFKIIIQKKYLDDKMIDKFRDQFISLLESLVKMKSRKMIQYLSERFGDDLIQSHLNNLFEQSFDNSSSNNNEIIHLHYLRVMKPNSQYIQDNITTLFSLVKETLHYPKSNKKGSKNNLLKYIEDDLVNVRYSMEWIEDNMETLVNSVSISNEFLNEVESYSRHFIDPFGKLQNSQSFIESIGGFDKLYDRYSKNGSFTLLNSLLLTMDPTKVKSTLIEAIIGFIMYDDGAVLFDFFSRIKHPDFDIELHICFLEFIQLTRKEMELLGNGLLRLLNHLTTQNSTYKWQDTLENYFESNIVKQNCKSFFKSQMINYKHLIFHYSLLNLIKSLSFVKAKIIPETTDYVKKNTNPTLISLFGIYSIFYRILPNNEIMNLFLVEFTKTLNNLNNIDNKKKRDKETKEEQKEVVMVLFFTKFILLSKEDKDEIEKCIPIMIEIIKVLISQKYLDSQFFISQIVKYVRGFHKQMITAPNITKDVLIRYIIEFVYQFHHYNDTQPPTSESKSTDPTVTILLNCAFRSFNISINRFIQELIEFCASKNIDFLSHLTNEDMKLLKLCHWRSIYTLFPKSIEMHQSLCNVLEISNQPVFVVVKNHNTPPLSDYLWKYIIKYIFFDKKIGVRWKCGTLSMVSWKFRKICSDIISNQPNIPNFTISAPVSSVTKYSLFSNINFLFYHSLETLFTHVRVKEIFFALKNLYIKSSETPYLLSPYYPTSLEELHLIYNDNVYEYSIESHYEYIRNLFRINRNSLKRVSISFKKANKHSSKFIEIIESLVVNCTSLQELSLQMPSSHEWNSLFNIIRSKYSRINLIINCSKLVKSYYRALEYYKIVNSTTEDKSKAEIIVKNNHQFIQQCSTLTLDNNNSVSNEIFSLMFRVKTLKLIPPFMCDKHIMSQEFKKLIETTQTLNELKFLKIDLVSQRIIQEMKVINLNTKLQVFSCKFINSKLRLYKDFEKLNKLFEQWHQHPTLRLIKLSYYQDSENLDDFLSKLITHSFKFHYCTSKGTLKFDRDLIK
ncbi:hypothetical protein DLAC_04338 [Tieghemostelium lacteum]|uniref:Uncharacterized protein n=1 Tax=Tieghemostelium lacteum TaxID=361077 RepID=A0A151ZJA4_TIELA|nr:hypothetical protein DLAC_04338 [Tieghemostelium lacteum]|eukprot:KYQ94063.1 hypothetical protein DLAC_04338 [Tieghemostelium lacteum]